MIGRFFVLDVVARGPVRAKRAREAARPGPGDPRRLQRHRCRYAHSARPHHRLQLFDGIIRYDQRKTYEEAEASAIGTEYLRADLLPPADGANIRALLKRYVDQRILFYTTRDGKQLNEINTRTVRLQAELWSAVQTSAVA